MICPLQAVQLLFILVLPASQLAGHRHKMMDSQTVTPLSLATKTVTSLPEFTSASNMSVVYTYTGGTAHIDCGVNLQGSDTVISWVRRRDLHIITIASITYTADRRFSCTHLEDQDVWRLSIKAATLADSGQYECQMSTEPKISKLFRLNVTDAMSRIQSGPSIYVKEGSVLNLTCVFSGHVTSAKHIHWWRGSELLNTADRGGISIVSNKVSGWSNLILSDTAISDSGVYRCEPSNAQNDKVQVNIIKDGDLAAGGLTGSGAEEHKMILTTLTSLMIFLIIVEMTR